MFNFAGIMDTKITHDPVRFITIEGARVHNLKNINVSLPRYRLIVFTGVSGSGKSSLAFDTIYAEGQRRFIETLSSYARQFMGNLEKPDVDKISGLSPVVAIDQKTISNNPRSTVGTITEIYDFLRLLYAKVSEARSYVTGKPMVKYSEQQMMDAILQEYSGKKIKILAPLVKGRKGIYKDLISQIKKKGFLYARIDGKIVDITEPIHIDRFKTHDIEALIDILTVEPGKERRLTQSIQLALQLGKGSIMIMDGNEQTKIYSKNLMCPDSGISFDDPSPNTFSFNSPYGSCPVCNGIGTVAKIKEENIIKNKKKSIADGAIIPLQELKSWIIYQKLEKLGKKYHFTLKTPLKDFSKEALDAVLFGTKDTIYIKEEGYSIPYEFEGIIPMIRRMAEESESYALKKWAAGFLENETCPECKGSRLKKEALYFYIDDKNIAQLADMPLENLHDFIASLHTKLNDRQMQIAGDILTEIKTRIQFILDVGLGYLTLNRTAKTLSGGEAQRIRLATQIGTGLTNVLYILDEPSIGLHQRDNQRLIESLKNIRDLGNTIIVVEHDKDIMLASDYLVDIGPGSGSKGGEVVAAGPPSEVIKKDSLTGKFLSEDLKIPVPVERRKGNGKFIRLKGARGNNLKNINLEIPLGKFICVTGVSGSGKSTLIHETLYPALHNHCYRTRLPSLDYDSIEGLEHIDKVIEIDQKPIGRTPRSNPVTYIGAWGPIRDLFAILPESKIRGYKPGRFSFNVKGGRCENCSGSGYQTIQMNFLPDVNILCPVCKGMRFNRETLQVKFKGKNIHDVLEMTVDEAVEFFENQPLILSKIKILQEVGLGYLKLGQPSNTLSGGEAQRIKLSSELNKKATGKTFYIMDEPTTGLHFKDIDLLLKVIDRLVDQGNTVLVIEHNMDVIKYADYIIDLGPEGGEKGGNITFCGSPEEMISLENNYTAYYLKKELKNLNSAKHAAERTFQS